jgi:hypothetical protein
MNKLNKLMHLTNADLTLCAEALHNTDSFDEGVMYVKPYTKKLKRGMLVTITSPVMTPSSFNGRTFKILKVVKRNKPTWVERDSPLGTKTIRLRVSNVLLLEDIAEMNLSSTYLNVPFFMEDPLAVKPAITEDKKSYHLIKKSK